jgi:nicotinamide-nucleotide amidase
MQAEIIAIGDELTTGQRLDTNSQWLANELGKIGVRVGFHTTIGDRLSDNIDAFRIAAQRCQIVISTGGLGPTADDLTRDAIAAAFDAPLEFRAEAMEHIERLFAHRKRPMPERNKVQAMFPESCRLIDNRFGTAPGIDFSVVRDGIPASRIFALPGVPSEMFEMYSEVVRPRLVDEMGLGVQQWFYKNLRLFGLGESDVEAQIPDLIARQREPIVGITVSQATINLRIATLASSQAEAELKWQSTIDEIQSHLGGYIYGADDDEPWDAMVRLLEEKNETLLITEYGFASVLGPRLVAAAAKAGSQTITGSQWMPSKPMFESFTVPSNYQMVLGPYPFISEFEPITGVFSIDIFKASQRVFTADIPVSGHPNIILQRLAKYAAKAFLDLK